MLKTLIRRYDAFYDEALDYSGIEIMSANRTRIVAADLETMTQVVFTGRGLTYQDGRPLHGFIEQVSLRNSDGEIAQAYSGFKVAADQIAGGSMSDFLDHLINRLAYHGYTFIGSESGDNFGGNVGQDKLFGRGGDDNLAGYWGHDELTGGAGNDVFFFTTHYGKDTITDFDAEGGEGAQDMLMLDDALTYTKTQVGRDTVLDFGNGDVLTLKKVDTDQIDNTDIIFI